MNKIFRKRERERWGETGARPPGNLNTKSPLLVQFPLTLFLSFFFFFSYSVPGIYDLFTSTCMLRVFLGVTRFHCTGRLWTTSAKITPRKKRAIKLLKCDAFSISFSPSSSIFYTCSYQILFNYVKLYICALTIIIK